VIVSEQEYRDAIEDHGISPNAYDRRNWAALEERGSLVRLPSDGQIARGVRFVASPGHTEGHQSVLVEGTQGVLLFTGDLLPLFRQAVPHYNMAYDVAPVVKTETKRLLLDRACREGWMLVLSHEPEHPVCRVVYRKEKGRLELEPE
jgi:glyoxylase-like metal-dependent hydrolase (beta-lactamase superfamily II)